MLIPLQQVAHDDHHQYLRRCTLQLDNWTTYTSGLRKYLPIMNSYPPDLLVQLSPVMFVAGLGPLQPLQTPTPPTPQSPAVRPQDPFLTLGNRLKDALLSQRAPAIWQPDKSKTFQVVLVDPDVRFPPRKVAPAEDQQFFPTHSPLSPLTPSSPLYPDGLIAPIWIRKHTGLVPSVFVLFKRLYEFPRATPTSPLEAPDSEHERDREAEEKRRDAELSAEIAQRKKSTNERAIKLTVVLMASRKLLDDPTLDARLTFIRRQSGLDPRAALFVLSPVSQAEIGDFVRSLQEALWEPAVEYYTNHSKRVRRKRNRHSQTNQSYPMPTSPSGPIARPLRPEGWTVRYEYKMACFAEFRGEDEVALKHYHDAYANLQIMFGSTAILPPRTKRWAEAKVLADCLSLKICKLYLYNNEHSLALSHHSMHIRKFADLSRGWGIGEETFEFWSWLARQHRAFAELLEQGTRTTLTIPTYLPSSTSAASTVVAQAADSQRSVVEMESLRTLGLNPTQALQHPGFYYFMAARCVENRRARFLAALENGGPNSTASPGFANENKVDHLTVILELYTRAYELFKKYSPQSGANLGRQTLWIAYRIARTYYDSGKFDMAVKFFERIAKTYRRESWDAMLQPLLKTWYACAQQLGDMELGVQLLIEMLAHGPTPDEEDPDAIQEDLLAVFRSTVPSKSDAPLVVDLSDAESLFDYSVIFWSPEVKVDERAAYQITLAVPSHVHISSLPFTSAAVYITEDAAPIIVRHADAKSSGDHVQEIRLGHSDYDALSEEHPVVEANLRWPPGSSIIFTGSLSSARPTTISIAKVVLTLEEASWTVDLPITPSASHGDRSQLPRWLTAVSPAKFVPIRRDSQLPMSSMVVKLRPHVIRVSISHIAPAYLGEDYPIVIEVTNLDSKELDVAADALLQPTEIEGATTSISHDKEIWSNLIKGIAFGKLAPGVSAVKTLYLNSGVAAGDRIIDLSIQSHNTAYSLIMESPQTPNSPALNTSDTSETLRTLIIPTADPIVADYSIKYKRSPSEQPGLARLETFDSDYWDESVGGVAIVNTVWTCTGPHGIKVEDVKLTRGDGMFARVTGSFLDNDPSDLLIEWLPGDQFSDEASVSFVPDDENPDVPIAGPGVYEISWRRILSNNELGPLAKSVFQLPQLEPPEDGLVALLDVPTTANLHVPIPIRMIIRNHRPTRSANVVVQVEFDATDGFVLSGLRAGRVPILLPGGEEILTWNAIPVECGYTKLPRIKVIDRRQRVIAQPGASTPETTSADGEGELVSVVDMRSDERPAVSMDGTRSSTDLGKRPNAIDGHGSTEITILVLP
ncbi:Gryzun, putative trafficking through golgi-domain-containing protein [Irpex rosettiformis]|uniref:Gryzun, putative trafficking through golgi-domain-containing protein n=1 Tax=Irpex rosettiformis TaxID=378272 RepID=A0ACB8U8U7_9APHY|nr:Gryzun, putative trafficking through golgi-domain-containing protein [Irpex rosettiformis]